MMRKIATARSGRNSIIVFITDAAWTTPAAWATVVFFARAMSVLPSGAIAPRKACGRMISRIVAPNPSPIARAASACPAGTVLTPERSASQTKAAV